MTARQTAHTMIDRLNADGLNYIITILRELEGGRDLNLEIKAAEAAEPNAKKVDVAARIGIAEGIFSVPEDFDAYDDDIADMFEGVAV